MLTKMGAVLLTKNENDDRMAAARLNSRFSESIDHFFWLYCSAIGTNKYAMSQHLSPL